MAKRERDATAERARPPRQKEPKQPKLRPARSGLVLSGLPSVNLMPLSEIERRATVTVLKRWLVALLATAAVVSTVVAGANWIRASAIRDLSAEQERTLSLNAELVSFAAVSKTLSQQADLNGYRTAAMGSDTEWRELFRTLVAAVPKGSEILDFTLVTGANPTDGADPATSIGLIGRLTLGTKNPQDHLRMVKRLRELDITLAAEAGALSTSDKENFTYVVDFVLNQAYYSGRFAGEEGTR